MKMTSDLCEDVVVRLSDSHNSSPATVSVSGAEASSGVWGGSGRTSSAGVELGRRLLMAARAGDSATVMELLARGAPFASDWLGTSPLHLAAVNAHPETCAVLLRSGVSRDLRTKVERTPLHLAASEGHTQVVQLLLDHGAQVDARDMLRMTPLHWAAQRGHAGVARLLLSHGADPNVLSKFYKTPHSLALERQDHEIVKLIEDAIKDREAAVSVNALFNEHMTETPVQEDQNIDNFESIVQTLKETSPPKNCKEEEKSTAEEIKMNEEAGEGAGADEGGGEGSGAEGAGAQLLRRHGITLLPADESSTVLNAIQSGRTVVLSDAGKLMLKESESETAPKKPVSNPKGVILTATPVKYPLKAGFKIFTLNNQFITKPKDSNKVPIKKIINPQLKQVKIVQMSPEAKAAACKAAAPMKPKVRGAAPAHRPALKIIMNKSNFNKLLANSEKSVVETIQAEVLNETATPSASEAKSLESDVDEILRVREDFLMQCSSKYLRAHALAARRALAALRAQLEHANERLAHFEHANQICE